MFIRVIDCELVNSHSGAQPDDPSEPATVKTKNEALYECHSVSKKWVERKLPEGPGRPHGETVMDLLLTMEGGGNISLQVEKRRGISIYFMNDNGRTIDSIQW